MNPALLAGAPRLSLYRYQGYADYDGFVVAGHVEARDRIALGIGFRHFDYGTIIEDDLGSDVDDLGASEQAFSLMAAARVSPRLSLGASVAYLNVDYFGSVTSATVMSVGALVSYSRRGTIGVALRSIGAAARNKDFGTRYPTPSRGRVGIAQGVLLGGRILVLAADAEVRLRDQAAPNFHAGAEWTPMPFLAVRSGIESLGNPDVSNDRQMRWSAGVGITIARVELGLGARFGGENGADELFFGVDAFR